MELPEEPFARWAFLHLIHDLASSSAVEASFDISGATLRFIEAPDFSAAVSEMSGGVEETPFGLSAGPFRVELLGPGS